MSDYFRRLYESAGAPAPEWDVVYVPNVLGEDEAMLVSFKADVVRRLIDAYALPLDRALDVLEVPRVPARDMVLDAVKITNVGGVRGAPALLPPRDGGPMETPKDVAAESIPPQEMPPHREYEVTNRMRARLENDYVYHPARPDQLNRYGQLRAAAKSLAYMICAYTPESREQSLALTSLETAIMQANAAIAREPEAQ